MPFLFSSTELSTSKTDSTLCVGGTCGKGRSSLSLPSRRQNERSMRNSKKQLNAFIDAEEKMACVGQPSGT